MAAPASRMAVPLSPALRVQPWLREATGAFGDMGTFIPILIGLVHFVGLDAAAILVCAGAAHIVTGLVFRIPLAIQPMKAIAALAIAGELTAAQVPIAGLGVAVCLLLLVLSGAIGRLERAIPRELNAAIQVAVAVKLAVKALGITVAGVVTIAPGPGRLWAGLTVAVMALLLFGCIRHRQVVILGLIALGFAWTAATRPELRDAVALSLWRPQLPHVDGSAWAGLWRGSLAQLPLTLLNSVFAVSLLAGQLYPQQAHRTSAGRIAGSVALMNLLTVPFGGMPVCHGSGGLAAQHACGARTGGSMVFLGLLKLGLGLFCGAAAVRWLHAFPDPLMGLFLLLAAWTLLRASRCWQSAAGLICAVVTVTATWATGWLPVGFGLGWLSHWFWTRRPTLCSPRRSP